MSIKIVFLGVMPEGVVEAVPPRLLNVGGYPFPHVALYATTAVLIVPRRLGTAIAAMIRIIRMTSKSSINEKPRSRVRSAFGRPGCTVVLMVRDPFRALVKKKGRKRIFLPGPEASLGVSCRSDPKVRQRPELRRKIPQLLR